MLTNIGKYGGHLLWQSISNPKPQRIHQSVVVIKALLSDMDMYGRRIPHMVVAVVVLEVVLMVRAPVSS